MSWSAAAISAHAVRDEGPGALVLAARAPAPGQHGPHAVQVRVLAQHVLQHGLRLVHLPLVEEGHGQEGLHQRVVGLHRPGPLQLGDGVRRSAAGAVRTRALL